MTSKTDHISIQEELGTEAGLLDFTPSTADRIEKRLNRLIDLGLEQHNVENDKPRNYMGGSRLGEKCDRRLAFELHQSRARRVEFEAGHELECLFPGKTLRRFRMGHWCEDEVAFWLKNAGFALLTHQPDGEQFGWGVCPDPETGEDQISGHIDGLLVGGPEIGLPYPSIWENKVMKASKWREYKKKGVQLSHPVYYYQCQVYMAYMSLKDQKEYAHAVFTGMNSDTSELGLEIIPYSAAAAQEASDRGVRVIGARSPFDLSRIATTPNDFRCKLCDFRSECWK